MMQADDGWHDAMRSGDFSRAWSISDRAIRARVAHPQAHLPRHFQSIWNGAPLEGRVLIRCDHGLGDTLQFSRYVPLVQRTASATTLWVPPALIEVLALRSTASDSCATLIGRMAAGIG